MVPVVKNCFLSMEIVRGLKVKAVGIEPRMGQGGGKYPWWILMLVTSQNGSSSEIRV